MKKILMVFTSLIAVVLLLLLCAYMVIYNYIGKVNIVAKDAPPIANSQPSQEAEYDDFMDVIEIISDDLEAGQSQVIENEDNQLPIMDDKDVLNILLIGSDTRIKGQAGRSDAIILVSINKKKEIITLTSILRDIYLKIPGRSKNRINSAYAYGGANLLMDTIEQNFNIKVDRYVSVDFESFVKVIDGIGGIEVEVTQQEIKVINEFLSEADQLTNEGTQLLNGNQTLAFARNRQVGNSDFSRTARQRAVIENIYNKVKKQNIFEISKLLNIILPQVTTNMTKKELFALMLSSPSYAKYDIQQWSVPMKGSYSNLRIDGMAVLALDFEKNIEELHSRIYD